MVEIFVKVAPHIYYQRVKDFDRLINEDVEIVLIDLDDSDKIVQCMTSMPFDCDCRIKSSCVFFYKLIARKEKLEIIDHARFFLCKSYFIFKGVNCNRNNFSASHS
jgi:hypothetical protein